MTIRLKILAILKCDVDKIKSELVLYLIFKRSFTCWLCHYWVKNDDLNDKG